jgi:DNA-binding MarR family transcriptional regulator
MPTPYWQALKALKGDRNDIVWMPDSEKVWKLTGPQFKLYFHYRRVTGDGELTCEEIVRQTAEACHLGTGTIPRARDQLEAMGLIKTKRVLWTGRGGNRVLVDLDDSWQEADLREKLREAGLSEDLIKGETPDQ